MMYQEVATLTLNQEVGLNLCLLSYLSDNNSDKISLGFGIYLNAFGGEYGRSPYSNVIWDWDIDCCDKADIKQYLEQSAKYLMIDKFQTTLISKFTPEWDNTFTACARGLVSGEFIRSNNLSSKQIDRLKQKAAKIDKERIKKIERIIYFRLFYSFIFELQTYRYNKEKDGATRGWIELFFDYKPCGLLTGIAGIEFPIWKQAFKIKENSISTSKDEILFENTKKPFIN